MSFSFGISSLSHGPCYLYLAWLVTIGARRVPSLDVLAISPLLGSLVFLVYRARRPRILRGVSSPPGPRGMPFLGLIRNVPGPKITGPYSTSPRLTCSRNDQPSTLAVRARCLPIFAYLLIFLSFIGHGRRANGMGIGSPSYDQFREMEVSTHHLARFAVSQLF